MPFGKPNFLHIPDVKAAIGPLNQLSCTFLIIPLSPFQQQLTCPRKGQLHSLQRKLLAGLLVVYCCVWEQFTKTVRGTFPLGATGKKCLEY